MTVDIGYTGTRRKNNIMSDILFKTEEYIFSYRVAGVCRKNGRVLLQKPTNDTGYAFPGGHAAFGETNEKTLIREFQEEIGASVQVGRLLWVAEIFFTWGKPCHQICLYYEIDEISGVPLSGKFSGTESLEGRNFEMEFFWLSPEELEKAEVYPENAVRLLRDESGAVHHFVYRET